MDGRDAENQRQIWDGAQQEVNALLNELGEMAKQISAQLDARVLRLETLIKQADERIERLGAVQNQAAGLATQTAAAAEASRNSDVYSLADQGWGAAEIAQALDRPKGEIELILALRG
ncbi:MAG TPA: hypothetical protein VF669_18320 [Tepidisphaeraceae bacterium]